jgi:hypothetical protein
MGQGMGWEMALGMEWGLEGGQVVCSGKVGENNR